MIFHCCIRKSNLQNLVIQDFMLFSTINCLFSWIIMNRMMLKNMIRPLKVCIGDFKNNQTLIKLIRHFELYLKWNFLLIYITLVSTSMQPVQNLQPWNLIFILNLFHISIREGILTKIKLEFTLPSPI